MTARQRIWGSGNASNRDVAENVRDVDQSLRSLVPLVTIARTITYAPPFTLQSDHIPLAVIVARCSITKQIGTVRNGTVNWVWANNTIRVDSIDIDASTTPVVGTAYDFVFLIIG